MSVGASSSNGQLITHLTTSEEPIEDEEIDSDGDSEEKDEEEMNSDESSEAVSLIIYLSYIFFYLSDADVLNNL
jgi:hypothetical protein